MKLMPVKFALNTGKNVITTEGPAYQSYFAFQRGVPTLWTTQFPGLKSNKMTVYVALTGEEIDAPHGAEYLGTAVNDDGNYVLHAYRIHQE